MSSRSVVFKSIQILAVLLALLCGDTVGFLDFYLGTSEVQRILGELQLNEQLFMRKRMLRTIIRHCEIPVG